MNHISKLTRSRWLLLTLFTLLVGVSPAWADELTINETTTTTNAHFPLYGLYADTQGSRSEFIIPEAQLSEMIGDITQMSFELNATSTFSATYQVYLKIVDNAECVYENYKWYFSGIEGSTVVYSGTLNGTSTTMDVEFNQNGGSFSYSGGNLLVGFLVTTKGSYNGASFKGVSGTNNAIYSTTANATTGEKEGFIPKVTFTYTPSGAVVVPKPKNLLISGKTHEQATLSWNTEDDTTWEVLISESSTKPATEQEATASPSTNSYQFTELSPATHYYVWVRAVKDAVKSDWAGTDFTTGAAPITSFPFEENFNSLTVENSIPNSWNNEDGTTTEASYKWSYNTTTSGNGATNGTSHDNSKCVRFNSFNNSEDKTNFLKTPVMSYAQNAPMQLKFWYKNPKGGDFSVYISNDGGETYATALAGCIGLTDASQWTEKVVDLPTDTHYNNVVIVFKGTSNWANGDAYIYLDDVTVLEKANAPEMKYEDGDFDFGVVDKDEEDANIITHTFTVKNSGLAAVSNLSITSNSADFTVGSGYAASIAAKEAGVDGSMTFTVTLNTATAGYKTGIITISADGYEGEDALKFNVSGAIMKSGTTTIDFNDNQKPNRWGESGATSYNNGAVYFGYNYYGSYITTPKVQVADGDFLVVKAKLNSNSSSYYVSVSGSEDGETFNEIRRISNETLNATNYTPVVVSGISTDYKYLRFTGYYCYVDEIAGIVYDANDPAITVTTDEEGNTSIASGSNYDFGTQTTEATKDYYIWNTGTGTLAVTNIAATGGYTVSPTSGNVASGESLHIVVTQPAPATTDGFLNGVLTITSTDLSDVTVNLSGFAKDEAKVYEDFSGGLPTGWTAGTNWSLTSGYYQQSSYNTSSALQTSKMVVAGTSDKLTFDLELYGNASYAELVIKKSADGTNWDDVQTLTMSDYSTSQWNKVTITGIEAGTYNFQFFGRYVKIDNIYGFAPLADDPVMEVYNDVDAKQTSGSYTLDFGMLTTQAGTKTFKIKNANTGTLSVTGIAVPDGYTVKDGENAASYPLAIAAGETKSLTLELGVAAKGLKNGNVVISATDQEDFTITAKGYVANNENFIDFEGSTDVPAALNVESGWAVRTDNENNELYYTANSDANFTTKKLTVSANTDVMAFRARRYNNGWTPYLTVSYSANGTDWTAAQSYNSQITSTNFTVCTLTGIEAGSYYFKFAGHDVCIDDLDLFPVDNNSPEVGVFSDEATTAAVADATPIDYGFVNSDQSPTYYIKNNGTGTLTINTVSSVDGFTTTEINDGNRNVDDKLAFTVSMLATSNEGYHHGTITITTNGGDFTIPVSGVMMGSRTYTDFAPSTAEIPATWTKNNWEYTASGTNSYIYSGTTSNDLLIGKMKVNEGEKLIFTAAKIDKGYVDSGDDPALSVSYKDDLGEWQTALALASGDLQTSPWKIYEVTGVPTSAEGREIKFTGARAYLQKIYGFEAVLAPSMVCDYNDDSYDFGVQTEAANKVFTITNNGTAALENLDAQLSGTDEDDFEVAISKMIVPFNGENTATVTVTLKNSNDYKVHNATLTISADDVEDIVIALTGKTRDVAKQYVEFATEIPNGWTSNGWSVTSGEAKATNGTLRTTPLTIAANETMAVDARISNSNSGSLKVRYTTNNGVDWQETTIPAVYNYNTCSTYTFNLGNTENAVTAFFEFVGENAVIDNFYGGVATTAPLLEVTENTSAVANNGDFDFGSNLQAEPAAKVFTLANKGNASMNVTIAKTGDVTVTPAAATIAAGETADVTVSLLYDQANVGDKTGAVTITLGTVVFTLNFTGNTIDPTALNEELASLPAGWYNAGWTVDGSAHIYSGVEKELISEQFAAEEGKNVLSFKAKAQSGNEGTLKVYTSTDRKTWSEPTEFALTNEYATKSLAALADGNYYVKFVSSNANIDDLTGLKKVTGIEHDLYVSASNIPAETKVPETSITATATVYSLRAAETGVYAKLFFDNVVVATSDAQDISLNGSKSFELTGNVPAVEKTYAAKIVVYYSDNSVAFETLTTNVEVQHTRTLAITAFERVGEGDLSANVDNKITAQFNVTVQNNSTCDLTADEVKVSIVNATGDVYQMNDADNVTAATAVLAKDESVLIPVTLTISAGEGGDFKFRAKELVSNTATLEANDITIHVNAQAPQFALNIKGGAALADGDDVAFGLVKEATTKHYTISNTGTKALVLTSIVAPAGYSVTEINNVNKTIAVNGTLDIDVTLLAEQGKKEGDLVFTYDVNGTPTTFTLALTGRSEAANVWEEYFTTEIPASWQKTGWTWNSDRQTAYSGNVQGEFTLMTPRLSAAAGQVLTYETKWQYDGENMTVQYSTDKTSWTDYETITASTETVERQFVAPAAGNYYLKFTANRYVNLDNFIGFALNIPEHDMELAASNVPTTGKRLNSYVATVTLKENAGKNENITAELWVNGANVNATADVTSVEANSNATVVTLTWEPQTTLDAVDAYVKVTYAGGTLETTPVSLTIAEVYTLSESSNDAVEAVTNETVMLERTFAAGWNTVCLPFAVADNTAIKALFGVGAKVFNFKNYANSMIDFETVTSMNAATPYLIYVPAAITEPIRVDDVTITGVNTTAGTVWHNNITFHGSYAPVAAGNLTGKYGVTPSNQLAKGNANTTMKGFRAYFEGNLANARILIFDEATGISRVYQAADLFGDDDRVYNMKGQQVENAKKGVYIVNGKKVVIK